MGIELRPETIEQYAAHAGRSFDVVVLSAVLEHVCEPDAMIAAAARLTPRRSSVSVVGRR